MHGLQHEQQGNKTAQQGIHIHQNNHRAKHRQTADDNIVRRIACKASGFT